MLFSCASTTATLSAPLSPDMANLPQTLRVQSKTPIPPSHIFAVPTRSKTIRLFPFHGTVIAAHCSRLAILPRSNVSPDEEGSLSLPVLPLTIPHPETFPLLQEYLYTKKMDILSSRLASLSSSQWTRGFVRAAMIAGLAENATFLGVSDDGFWQVVDNAWAKLLREFSVNRGAQ